MRVAVLIALALVVRALVPAGWMPVADGMGVRLALCPGQAPTAHAMPSMSHGPEHGGKGLPDHPCAFAALGLAAGTVPPSLALLPRAVPVPAPIAQRDEGAIGRGLAAPPPPATGPPAFA